MEKKTIKITLLCVLGILIIIPVFINCLMFFNFFPVKGTTDIWIPTLGTFWGAILGGVISGAITLIGVRLTIKDAENVRKHNEYPLIINNLEKLIKKLENNLKEINKYTWLKVPYDLNTNVELRLYIINQNLELVPTKDYIKIIEEFLFDIKENILGIDAKWYKDYFELRNKIKYLRSNFESEDSGLKKLFEEAQDYFLENFDPLKSWKDYAEVNKSEEFNQIIRELSTKELSLIYDLHDVFSDFKHQAELYQMKLLKSLE